jgi:hypothetical protein
MKKASEPPRRQALGELTSEALCYTLVDNFGQLTALRSCESIDLCPRIKDQ